MKIKFEDEDGYCLTPCPFGAAYRIVRYDGKYRVECLDKPYNFWYIVASNFVSLQAAVDYCVENFEV